MVQKSVTGFIKTENAVLLIVVGLAVGFVAGIVFSAYRSSSQSPVKSGAISSLTSPAVSTTAQQAATQSALLKQTQDNPNDANAWVNLGNFYFDNGQPEKAVQSYETSLDLNPNNPDTWTDLGVMYRRLKKSNKAIDCFDRALAINPSHEVALFNKGIVLMHDMQDVPGALAQWEKLVAVNPQAHTPNGVSVKELIEQLKKTK